MGMNFIKHIEVTSDILGEWMEVTGIGTDMVQMVSVAGEPDVFRVSRIDDNVRAITIFGCDPEPEQAEILLSGVPSGLVAASGATVTAVDLMSGWGAETEIITNDLLVFVEDLLVAIVRGV